MKKINQNHKNEQVRNFDRSQLLLPRKPHHSECFKQNKITKTMNNDSVPFDAIWLYQNAIIAKQVVFISAFIDFIIPTRDM